MSGLIGEIIEGTDWYELLLHPPVTIRIQIHPGDRIAVNVSLSGTCVHVRLRKLTSQRIFAKTIPAPPQRRESD